MGSLGHGRYIPTGSCIREKAIMTPREWLRFRNEFFSRGECRARPLGPQSKLPQAHLRRQARWSRWCCSPSQDKPKVLSDHKLTCVLASCCP